MATKTVQKQDGLEKLLRYVLGCRPDEFGLHPDENGWVPLKSLLAALRDEDGWRGVREGQIMMLVNQPGDLSPLELTGADIRLKPGLSSLPPEAPAPSALPKVLYLALKPAAWAVIHEKGLFPKPGDMVSRLWADKDLALKVGRRQTGDLVLITVQAGTAAKAGSEFSPYSELLWLTTSVPPRYLSGPPVALKEEEAPAKKAPAKAPEPAGSFHLGLPDPQIHRGKKKGKHGDSPDWKNQTRRDRRRHEYDE